MPNDIERKLTVTDDGSDVLKQAAADADRLSKATEDQGKAANKAASADRSRISQLDAKRQRLVELQKREIDLEDAVREGSASEVDASRISRSRQQHIDRLSRSIATQEDRQDELNRRVKESVGAHRKQTDATNTQTAATDRAAGKQSILNRVLGAAKSQIAVLAAGFVGAQGLISLYTQWIERIEKSSERLKENAEVVRENAQARLDFVALRGVEDAEDVQKIDTLAVLAGRSPGEIARGAAVVQSVLPESSFTPEQRDELLTEAAVLAQSRETPVNEIVKSLVPFLIQGLTARQASNLFVSGVDQAGEADPGRFGRVVAELLPILTSVGGLDAGEATGFAAGSTGLGIDADKAKTGLRNLVLGIRNPDTPDKQAILDRLGITGDGPLLDDIHRLSDGAEAGLVTDAEIIELVGEEGVAVALALSDPATLETFTSRVRTVDADEERTDSIAAERSGNIFTPGSIQGSNLLIKQLEAGLEAAKAGDARALAVSEARAALELRLETLAQENIGDPIKGLTAADIEEILRVFDDEAALGRDIDEALEQAVVIDASDTGRFRIPNFVPVIGGDLSQALLENTEITQPRRRFRNEQILPQVQDVLEAGPQTDPGTVIQNQTVINGTQINNSTDPATGDRELPTGGRR